MDVFTGRPPDADTRDGEEKRSYDLLDALGVEYKRVDHEPAMTMAACDTLDKALGVHICKNLFLTNRQKTKYWLLLMPGDKPFKTKELSAQLNVARLSFADEAPMRELLGLRPGSVSVLGLMNDAESRVQLVIDSCLLNEEYFGCHPCRNTSTVRFRTRDLTERIIPAMHHEPVIVSLQGDV